MSFKKRLVVGASGLLMLSGLSGYANADLMDNSGQRLVRIAPSQNAQQAQSSNLNQADIKAQAVADANYAFPESIQDGYWAMLSSIDGTSTTVEFSDKYIHIHRFQCLPDGSYQKLDAHNYAMEPVANGMGLKRNDGSHYSQLNLIKFEPKKSLLMHQSFIANLELKRAMPEGVDLQYTYTPELVPACPKFN